MPPVFREAFFLPVKLKMNRQTFSILFVVLSWLFLSEDIKAQFYYTGQEPPSVKWNQINTSHFQVILPENFYIQANRFANILEAVYESSAAGLNHHPSKVPVIMHTQSVQSNGYVVWAPKRMEVVTTSPQNSYSLDWLEQLAIHEIQHVVQIDKLNQGFTKFLSFPFGQMAPGAMTGFLPFWFLEGDAVANETALTNTGRGRMPSFEMPLKAIEMEKSKRLSYDQSYLGSYKNYVPSYYNYGFYITSFARLKYNQNIWSKTLDNVARRPFTIAPFYFGLKKQTGLSKVGLYEATFDSLKTVWRYIKSGDSPYYEKIKTPQSKLYTNYRYPVQIGFDSIIAVKSGIDDITRFVLLAGGKESIIHTPGYHYSSPLAVSKSYIAWEEIGFDPRWENRDYSNIKILNRKNGRIYKLQKKSKHFSPAISPNEKMIVVINNNEHYESKIEIFDLKNPVKITDIAHPEGDQLSYPIWLNDSIIIVVGLNEKGINLYLVNLKSHDWTKVFGPTLGNITKPVLWNAYIIFNHDIRQQNNIYALNLKSKQLYQITDSKYGAFDPSTSFNGNTLLLSQYSVDGYKLYRLDPDPAKWKQVEPEYYIPNALADSLSSFSPYNLQETKINIKEYEAKNYNKLLNSFHIHSWLPFYFNSENPLDLVSGVNSIYPGLTLYSQNKTSTVISTLSYYFAENHHHFYPELNIRAWYPVITIGANIGGLSYVYNQNEENSLRDTSLTAISFHSKLSLPLNLTNGKYYIFINPYIKYSFANNFYYYKNEGYQRGRNSIEYTLVFSNLLKQSKRDIKPRWGQTLVLSHTRKFPRLLDIETNWLAKGTLYFPGLFRHHVIYVSAGYEDYYDRLSHARGFPEVNYFLYNYRNLSANYTLPIISPDLTLGPIVYLRRIHADTFFDHADYHYFTQNDNGNTRRINEMQQSLGIELSFESNFLRFIVPVTPTVQYSYRLNDGKSILGFYLTINTSFF